MNKADPGKFADGKTQWVINDERTVESALPQGRGESLVAQLDSAVNQAEQLRDQQVQQQYSDRLGVYVQEKAEQIERKKLNSLSPKPKSDPAWQEKLRCCDAALTGCNDWSVRKRGCESSAR